MMKKDWIFFGDNGITDTKANNIADFAKLAYTEGETMLASIGFVNEKIETINGENRKDLTYGMTDLSDIEQTIERIGALKSLCAWLREAIKAHQTLIKEVQNYSFTDYVKDNNLTLPQQPEQIKVLTEDDVIAEFDIKKRNRYYYLETQAATIGQIIHKSGSFDNARKRYYDKLQHPRRITGEGLNTIIYTYEPSVDKEVIENVFNTLQHKHSKYQNELNSIKSEIKSRITNDEIENRVQYEKACNEYTAASNKLHDQYLTWRAQEEKRIASLKIIIPNALKDIFDKVASQGNKE